MSEVLEEGQADADRFAAGSVTVKQLGVEFGIGRTTAYELMNSGKLPYSTATGRRLIPRVAVKKLLAGGLVGGTKAAA